MKDFLANHRVLVRSTIALIAAALLVVALVAAVRYGIVHDKQAAPPTSSQPITASDEDILRSIAPPEGVKPMEISKEILESIAPPKGAKPAVIDQAVLDSIVPPKR